MSLNLFSLQDPFTLFQVKLELPLSLYLIPSKCRNTYVTLFPSIGVLWSIDCSFSSNRSLTFSLVPI